jgi:hypothetical protein
MELSVHKELVTAAANRGQFYRTGKDYEEIPERGAGRLPPCNTRDIATMDRYVLDRGSDVPRKVLQHPIGQSPRANRAASASVMKRLTACACCSSSVLSAPP